MDTDAHATLHQLLDANRHFALLARGPTNHCPMVLCALADMGASAARLQDFFDTWSKHYAVPAGAETNIIERVDWCNALGQNDAFNALQRCFVEWIACDGSAVVMAQVLPRAVAAPASVAFHALIRLGHGLAVDNGSEIAAGLAAFVTNPLQLTPTATSGLDLAAVSAPPASDKTVAEELALLQQACAGVMVTGNWINDRLQQVAQHVDFIHAFRPIAASRQRIDELAEAAIRLFWRTKNFTALHMVTVVHAARRVCPVLPPTQATLLLAELWRAFCAAYISVLATNNNADWQSPIESTQRSAESDWQPLLHAAVASNDDHVIKLVQACWHESKRALVLPAPPPTTVLYHLAAARACGLNTATR